MKKILVAVAVLAVGIFMAGSAFAAMAVQGDVTINATVSTGCSAIAPGTFNLAIDPTVAGNVVSAGAPATVQCVKNTAYTVDAFSVNTGGNSGTGTLIGSLKSGALAPIPYTLTFTNAFNGNGFGGPVRNVTLIGAGGVTVLAADVAVAEFGPGYSDTVTLTVNY